MWIEKQATHTREKSNMFQAIKSNPGTVFLLTSGVSLAYGACELLIWIKALQGAA